MRFSADALGLVKQFEGLRLQAYRDPVGIWTIGYGNTRSAEEGLVITEADADRLLQADLEEAERSLLGLPESVQSAMTQGQWDALCDWIFNLGAGAWLGSTLRKCVLLKNWPGAALQIPLWVHAGGQVLPGLVARREAEVDLFTKPAGPGGENV